MNKAILLKEKKVRGNLSEVYNKDAHPSAAPIYYHLHAGKKDYLFTPDQLEVAEERAKDQQEDLVDIRSFWERVIDTIFD